MSSKRQSQHLYAQTRGMTLVEVLVSIVIAAIALLAVTSFFVGNSQLSFRTKAITNSVQELTLFNAILHKTKNRLFYKPIFMNQNILDRIFGNGVSAIKNTGAVGGLIASQNFVLDKDKLDDSQLEFVGTSSNVLTLLMIGPERGTEIKINEIPSSPGVPYVFASASTSQGMFYVESGVEGYAPGDLISISTAEGIQIVQLRSYNGNELRFTTLGNIEIAAGIFTTMPLGLIPAGSVIHKVTGYVLGTTLALDRLTLGRVSRQNGRSVPGFAELATYPRVVERVELYNMRNPTQRLEQDFLPLANLGLLRVKFVQGDEDSLLEAYDAFEFVF